MTLSEHLLEQLNRKKKTLWELSEDRDPKLVMECLMELVNEGKLKMEVNANPFMTKFVKARNYKPRKSPSVFDLKVAARGAAQAKVDILAVFDREGQPCWWELRPYEIMEKLAARITQEELDAILAR